MSDKGENKKENKDTEDTLKNIILYGSTGLVFLVLLGILCKIFLFMLSFVINAVIIFLLIYLAFRLLCRVMKTDVSKEQYNKSEENSTRKDITKEVDKKNKPTCLQKFGKFLGIEIKITKNNKE